MAVLPVVFDALAHQALSNFDLARDLARQGVSVFPCQPDGAGEKQPCPGVLWRQQSTTDDRVITNWWTRWPDAMPGIDLGKIGILVIDCDRKPGKPDGVEAFHALATSNDDALEGVPLIETPSGGCHYYFRQWGKHGNGRGSLPAGIDVRGNGGYVIAPGATFLDGRRYEEVDGHYLTPGEAPEWLIRTVETSPQAQAPRLPTIAPGPPVSDERKRLYGHTAMDAECGDLSAAQPGGRNEAANTAAFRLGQLVGGGCLTESEAYAALANACASWGIPAGDKVYGPHGTLTRGIRAGARSPRTVPEDEAVQIVTIERRIVVSEDGTRADAETGEVIEEQEKPSILDGLSLGRGTDWTRPGGLLEAMTDWMLRTSRRPNRPLCVASATAILSAVCGRHLYGPTASSMNLYITCIADTSVGKNRPFSAVAEILRASGLERLQTTGKGFSVSALETLVTDFPSVVATVDEIGANLLGKMSNARANNHEVGMRGALLELWSREKGMAPFATHHRATAKSVEVPCPSFTLFGASTPEAFYGALTTGSTRDGFLNRFLIAHAAPRAKKLDFDPNERKVPDTIKAGLWKLLPPAGAGNLDHALRVFDLSNDPDGDVLQWDSDAVRRAADDFEEEILELSDANPEQRPLMGRIFEYAMRLAGLHAVSRSGRRARVTMDDLHWGAAWSVQSARHLIEDAASHISSTDYEGKLNLVRKTIEEAGVITRRELLRKVRTLSARDRDDVIKHLIEGGWIENAEFVNKTNKAQGWKWVG